MILKGTLPCDPGGEGNVESKRACKASEDPQQNTYLATQRISRLAQPQRNYHAPAPITIVSSRCLGVDPFSSLKSIERARRPSWVLGESKSHSCHARSRSLLAPLLAVSPSTTVCRLLVSADGPQLPRLATATLHDHSVNGPFIHLSAPCMDAAPGPVNAAPPPQQPASALTCRDHC